MNIYFIGMCIAMVLYIVIGFFISRKIKDANDFYVAGRRAPVLLIAGSMIASYTSTGMFMGDAAQCYSGALAPVLILAGMQSAGYMIGAVFFGRYLRRSQVLTIPEFFGKRFCSERMKKLAAVTAIITMTVYLLSIMQGIGTLMTAVTGVDYNVCITIALIVFTIITVTSGSSGVLITDTIMAGVFTFALILATLFISGNMGGWFDAIKRLSADPEFSQMLSWGGKPGVIFDDSASNVVWGITYGIVWLSVCMVGPWQSSRYLMAKNEHVVVRSAPISALGIFILEFLVGISAVMVNLKNPGMEDPSQVMIWAAINILPKFLGVVLLTGVLSAGISSATTFLSLVGASVANDLLKKKENSIRTGQITMVIVSAVVLVLAIFNPPSIFWIMFLGGAIVASSWMPVALAGIFSKRVTKTGAFCGMLFGFVGCFAVRLYTSLAGVTLPVYLDPSIVGMGRNVIAMVIGSVLTQVTKEEKEARAALFVMPDSEKNPVEIKKTMTSMKLAVAVGPLVAVVLLVFWIIPYLVFR